MKSNKFTDQVIDCTQSLKQQAFKLCRNHEWSNDLVQDTIYKALTNHDKFKENSNLKGWLFTIMRNKFINEYRRNNRHPVLRDDTGNGYIFEREGDYMENEGESNMTMAEIRKAFDQVDEKYTVPFMMHFEGFRYEEIANQMNQPLGTIKSRIFTARKYLQSSLEPLYRTSIKKGALQYA